MSATVALDDAFRERMTAVFHGDGRRWLDNLPQLLDEFVARWGLTLEPPFMPLRYGYVAPATRADGTPVVLKASVPRDDLQYEIAAVQHYDGRGCARLLDADVGAGVLLLERVEPGTTILHLTDDDEATRIAAGIMRQLWRPSPPNAAFPTIADWGRALPELRERHGGGTGSLPVDLFEYGESLYARLVATQAVPVVLHGDLHHGNILRGTRAPWLAIDPHGVVGEPAFEVGTWVRNAIADPDDPFDARRTADDAGQRNMLARRLEIFAEELSLDRDRLRDWSIAITVLSAAWSDESNHANAVRKTMAVAAHLAAL